MMYGVLDIRFDCIAQKLYEFASIFPKIEHGFQFDLVTQNASYSTKKFEA